MWTIVSALSIEVLLTQVIRQPHCSHHLDSFKYCLQRKDTSRKLISFFLENCFIYSFFEKHIIAYHAPLHNVVFANSDRRFCQAILSVWLNKYATSPSEAGLERITSPIAVERKRLADHGCLWRTQRRFQSLSKYSYHSSHINEIFPVYSPRKRKKEGREVDAQLGEGREVVADMRWKCSSTVSHIRHIIVAIPSLWRKKR